MLAFETEISTQVLPAAGVSTLPALALQILVSQLVLIARLTKLAMNNPEASKPCLFENNA